MSPAASAEFLNLRHFEMSKAKARPTFRLLAAALALGVVSGWLVLFIEGLADRRFIPWALSTLPFVVIMARIAIYGDRY